AKNIYINTNCQGLLAIGGGSSIDTAKGVGVLLNNKTSLMSMSGINKVKAPLPPFIAIPTTCGTGSEVTNVTMITDENNFKQPIISPYIIPDVAILDPKLLCHLPPDLIASTGMDALTH